MSEIGIRRDVVAFVISVKFGTIREKNDRVMVKETLTILEKTFLTRRLDMYGYR